MNTGTSGIDPFPGVFDRYIAGGIGSATLGGGPADPVGNDPLDLRMMVNGVTFVARAEIKDATAAATPGASAPEHLAALEPGDEYQIVWSRDAEGFAVHFALLQFDVVIDAVGDGVSGIHHPDAFPFPGLAPAQGATGAEDAFEEFGPMTAVEDDESHAFEHAGVDAGDDVVSYLVMGGMPPPREDVGIAKDLLGETVIGFGQGCGSNGVDSVASESLRESAMDAVWINLGDLGMLAFVDVFVPDRDAKGWHGVRRAEEGPGENQKR